MRESDTQKCVSFTVPLVPPGLNHYVRHTKAGRHYQTGAATAFKDAVVLFARRAFVVGKSFSVDATIYLGAKERGDVDGFGKLILDGLAKAEVFRTATKKYGAKVVSDAWVTEMRLRKTRSLLSTGYTEITVTAL